MPFTPDMFWAFLLTAGTRSTGFSFLIIMGHGILPLVDILPLFQVGFGRLGATLCANITLRVSTTYGTTTAGYLPNFLLLVLR